MTRRFMRLIAIAAALGLVAGGAASARQPRSNSLQGEGEGLKLIKNIPWGTGTDMEVVTIKGRDYLIGTSREAANEGGGVHIVDVTNPAKAKEIAVLPCVLSQGDIQISHDKKTVLMAADSAGGPDGCTGIGKLGFMTIDISNIRKPRAVGFAEIPRGSHNITAHPKKPFVYNSDSELTVNGEIQIWSIKNPRKPKLVNTVPSQPHSPHDISFNKKGDMAVTAAISHFDLFDTSDPANPELLFTSQCPGCSITHDAKFTPDGTHLFIGDEGGGGAPYPCPGGALYAYQMQGTTPVLTGAYEPGEVAATSAGPGACTAHVFEITPDSKRMAISWYTAGTRYLDISNPAGPTFGPAGTGIQELGWFIPEGADSWSSKFSTNGKYIFSNDIVRGLDIYKITAEE
ncbi:MAG: LVIVD repeat-containing protein [Actinomycetota bacterium]